MFSSPMDKNKIRIKSEYPKHVEDLVDNLVYIVKNENILRKPRSLEEIKTPLPLYVEGGKDVLSILQNNKNKIPDSIVELLSSEKHVFDEEKSQGMLRETEKPVVRAHVAKNDNIVMQPVIKESSHKRNNTDEERPVVRDIKGGLDVATRQAEITWKNIGKNIQRELTRDEQKRAKLQQEIDSLGREYDNLPQTQGLATVASVATNIVGVALPTVIAGALAGPELAAGVGLGVMGMDYISTLSQANMEIDSYERNTGNKVSDKDRNSYVVALTATDMIMNVLLGGNMLKGVTKSTQREIAKRISQEIFDNPVAQQEFNTMTRRVLQNEQRSRVAGVARAGIEGGVTSGVMEGEKSIYTHEAPELNNIVASTISGMLSGSSLSGVSAHFHKKKLHDERMNSDKIYYVSENDPQAHSRLPISEIVINNVSTDKKGNERVVGEVVSPDVIGGVSRKYDLDNVVGGSYAKAMEEPNISKKYDDLQIPEERVQVYHEQWEFSKEMVNSGQMNSDDIYSLQNEIVQRMAADMGLPIQVYARIDDLPEKYRNEVREKNYAGFTTPEGGTAIILEQCKNMTAHNVEAVLRHENLGHKGLRRLYKDRSKYEKALDRAGYDLLSNEDKNNYIPSQYYISNVEERGALKTENRPYSPIGTPNIDEKDYENYTKLYQLLKRSEEKSRNSTTNELRRGGDIGGYPMPTLYDLDNFDY